MKYVLTVLIILVATSAQACYKCGNYRSCTYKPAPVVYQKDGDNIFAVINNYPNPLVGQGNTPFYSNPSYQNLVLPLFDPNRFFAQEQQLQQSLDQVSSIRHQRYTALAQRVADQNEDAVKALAKGQAAKMTLEAAGLNTTVTQESNSKAIVVSKDKVTVQQGQVQQGLVGKYCGSCHGLDNPSPKGQLYLGDDKNAAETISDDFALIRRVLKNGDMPPPKEPQPSDEEKAGILDELDSYILKHLK